MAKSKNGLIATALTVISFLFIIIAFSTPNWLQSDGKVDNPKFGKLGLWEVCFTNFQEPHHWFDTKFHDCWWIFEEEFYIIYDFLLPGFFVAVQFFYTLCLTLTLIAILAAALYMACSRENDKFVFLLLFLGSSLTSGAFFGTIAVGVFGAQGDSRIWMPNWEHNDMGWSFALAVIGVVMEWVAGVLYLIEARRHRKKRKVINSTFQMGERRPYTIE